VDLLVAAPVAAVERAIRLEEERTRDPLAALDHLDHLHRLGERLREVMEEARAEVVAHPVVVGRAPIKPIEVVESLLVELAARDPGEAIDRRGDAGAFLAQLLALARGELTEEVVERPVAAVLPVELEARAREEPELAERRLLLRRTEQPVDRRAAGVVRD